MNFLLHPTRAEAMSLGDDGAATLLSLDGDAPRVVTELGLGYDAAPAAASTDGERVFLVHDGFVEELGWGSAAVEARVAIPRPLGRVDAITPDGRFVVHVSPPAFRGGPQLIGILVLDRSSNRIHTLQLPADFPSPVAFDPRSRRMACLFTEQGGGGVAVWELERGAAPHVEIERGEEGPDLADAAGLCAFDAAGERLVALAQHEGGGSLHIVDVRRGVELAVVELAEYPGEGVTLQRPAMSRDGKRVACAVGGDVRVYDAGSGAMVARAHVGAGDAIAAVHFDVAREWIWVEQAGALVGCALLAASP